MAQRPYVLLSAAMPADGYVHDAVGQRIDPSGAADWKRVVELRSRHLVDVAGAQVPANGNYET